MHIHNLRPLGKKILILSNELNYIAMMIQFISVLALAFVSFIASAFVILRIVMPILPYPLSRQVPPVHCISRMLDCVTDGPLW